MIDNTRVLSKSLALSLAGFMFVLGLGELALFTFSTNTLPPHYNPYAVYFVYLSSFLVLPVLMYLGTKYSAFKLPAIIWFHITAGVLLLWFSELFTPFTALWSLMVLFASIYYGWKGFAASCLQLVAIGVTYCILFWDELQPTPLIYTVLASMAVLMTIVTSYLFMRIITNAHRKNIELEKATRSEQLQVNRQTTLLNSISDAVLTLNRYGRVTSQNAAAQAFFDTNESLIGRDIDRILQLIDMSNKPASARELMSQTKTTLLRDDLSIGSGGDIRHLSLQMSRIRSTFDDDEEYGVVLIIRDITKQKTLEDEKDEFISVTSHELRTPVAIAEGSLSNLLLMEERKVEPDKLRSAAEMAHEQVLYLAKMVNDLSTLSRAERGVGDGVEEININALLQDLFIKYSPEAEEKSLALDLDAETNLPKVETSRLYLEEILENFLTNALKYTKTGTITLGAKLTEEGNLQLWVKDSGIGMSKSDLEHIFEKFYRSEDYRTRETGGTGLGLYVVSKLAAKLNTKIDVESRLNHGSTFSLIIQLPNRENQQVAEESVAAQA